MGEDEGGTDSANDKNKTPPPSYEAVVEMKNVVKVKPADPQEEDKDGKEGSSKEDKDGKKEKLAEPEDSPVGVLELVSYNKNI